MVNAPSFDSGGGGGGTDPAPEPDDGFVPRRGRPGPTGGPTITSGGGGGSLGRRGGGDEEEEQKKEGEEGGGGDSGGQQQGPDDEVVSETVLGYTPGPGAEDAIDRLASMHELIDRGDIEFVKQRTASGSTRTVARVNQETARLLGRAGYVPPGAEDAEARRREFIVEGGRAGETGGGEDAGAPGGAPPTGLAETGGGEDLGFQGGDPVSIVTSRADRAVDESEAAARADAAGVVNPALRKGVTADLVPGSDYDVDVTWGEAGPSASVTGAGPGTREDASAAFADWAREERGADLVEGEDYRMELTTNEEGRAVWRADPTRSGRAKLGGDEHRGQLADVDVGGLPGAAPGTTLLDVKDDAAAWVQQTADWTAEMTEDFYLYRAAYNPAGGSYGVTEPPPEPDADSPAQEQAEAFLRGAGGIATAPVSVGVSAADLTEFGLAAAEAHSEGGAGEVTLSAGRGPMGAPAPEIDWGTGSLGFAVEETEETAAGAVEEVTEAVESPTGRAALAGSFVASAGIMGGAALAPGRLGLASRLAIQPGEEALGIGLHRGAQGAGRLVGRPGAGQRAADVLAPGKEFLPFSEEFWMGQAARPARWTLGKAETARDVWTGDAELWELNPSMLSAERAGRFRPGGPTSELGAETTQAAAPSEPLGSWATEQMPLWSAGVEARLEPGERDRLEAVMEELDERTRPAGATGVPIELHRIAEAAQDAQAFDRLAAELGVSEEELRDAYADGGVELRHGAGEDLAMRQRRLDDRFSGFAAGMIDAPRSLRRTARETGEARERAPPDPLDVSTPDLEPPGPMEPDLGRSGLETEREALLEEERRRQRLAARPSVEEEADTESRARERLRYEPLSLAGLGLAVGFRGELDVGLDYDLDFEQRQRAPVDLETELEPEPEPETEPEPEREPEPELEPPWRPEPEPEPRPGYGRRRRPQGERDPLRLPGERRARDEDPLAAGYLVETVAGFAGLGVAGGDPLRVSQASLEAQEGSNPFGEFAFDLTGEQAAEFEAAEDLLGLGDGGGEEGWL